MTRCILSFVNNSVINISIHLFKLRLFQISEATASKFSLHKRKNNKDIFCMYVVTNLWIRVVYLYYNIQMVHDCEYILHILISMQLTLYVAVTQFTYGKLRYCYVKS